MTEKIMAGLPSGDANYIFAGDLNATPYSRAATLLRREGGLRNAGPALAQKTWTTKPFTIGPWSYEALDWRLDYVLYKAGLRPVRAEILQTDLSDHLPILVEFVAV